MSDELCRTAPRARWPMILLLGSWPGPGSPGLEPSSSGPASVPGPWPTPQVLPGLSRYGVGEPYSRRW